MISKLKHFKGLVIVILLATSFMSCGSKELVYSKNKTKQDTIYIYYKGYDKNEFKHKYINDSITNYYQIEYKFIFNYELEYIGGKKHYSFENLSHNTSGKKFIKIPIFEKGKIFLKENKDKIFTYKDLKNKSEVEIMKFYNYNRFKTVFLIDKTENKNNKIYLRKVFFGSNIHREL